jgi:AraC-like DNA-binding protein
MLQVLPAPTRLSHWIDGAVIIRLGSAPGVSRFPATPHAMLTMRLARPIGHADAVPALSPPITFHTLSTAPVAHAHGGDLIAMGLLVRPAAAACLLGATTGATVDAVLPWDALAGPSEAARLEAAVHRAGSDLARLRALMDSFERLMLAVSKGHDRAYARLCAAVGLHGALAGDELGLGRRQLERRCQSVLGLSPKHFQRIVRFHHALSMAMRVADDPAPLTTVALDTGFYDQSHLARDARRLAGAPVGHVIAQARPDAPWWPLAARVTPLAGGSQGW